MAAARGLVGPFPPGVDPESYDRLRRRALWSLPSGLYLVGSHAGRRRNLMTLNWAIQLAFEPKLLGISVEREARTHELIEAGRVFSLSVLRREDRAVVRKFVKPVPDPDPGVDGTATHATGTNGTGGGQPSQLAGQPVVWGRTGAPILAAAVAWMDCELRHSLPLGSHTLFVGEIVDAGATDSSDGAPEVLRLEDTRMSYGG